MKLFSKSLFNSRCLPALILLLTLAPHAALAQSITLGDVMCNVVDNVTPFAWLMNGIAYILGAMLIGQGLVLLVRYADRGIAGGGDHKLNTPILHMIRGACLLFLPSAISVFINSVFGYPGGGGFSVCVATPPSGGGSIGICGNVTLSTLMTNLVTNIKDAIVALLSILAIVIGVLFMIRGLISASKYGLDPKTHSISKILANIIACTALFVIGQSLDTVMTSVFGSGDISSFSIINWSNFGAGLDTQQFQDAVHAALTFVQIIGMIAFIRGFLILKSVAEGSGGQQVSYAAGFTHIIGGVFAINIYYFLVVMDTTFGTNLLS